MGTAVAKAIKQAKDNVVLSATGGKSVKPSKVEEITLEITPKLVGFEVLAEAGKAKQGEINKMVERACLLVQYGVWIKNELEKAKDYFEAHFDKTDQKKIITRKGTVECSTSNKYSVPANKVNVLERLFGDEFLNFVMVKTDYGVSAKLRALLHDGDYEHRDLLRGAVAIGTTTSVKFSPLTK